MSKLQLLTQFLQENLPKRIGNQEFRSEMDEMTFIPAQRDLGLGQYQMAIQQYDAVLSWGRWPYRQFDPCNLNALLFAWLTDHCTDEFADAQLDPEWPTLVVEVNDDDTALVIVTVRLADALTLIEDEQGNIPFDGKRWRLAAPEIWWAQAGAIYGADETGAPLGNAL